MVDAATAIIVNCFSRYFYSACEGPNVCVRLPESTLNAVRRKAAAAICPRLRGRVHHQSMLPKPDFPPSPADPWRICAACLCHANWKTCGAINPPVRFSVESGKINLGGSVWLDQQLSHLLKVQTD